MAGVRSPARILTLIEDACRTGGQFHNGNGKSTLSHSEGDFFAVRRPAGLRAIIEASGIDPTIRGESLQLSDFIKIAITLSK